MLNQFRYLVVTLLLLVTCSSWAITFYPYSVSVPVSSRSQVERDQAMATALEQTFIKLSGEAQVDKYPALMKAKSKAANYVQQYTYTGGENSQLFLSVHFNHQAINTLLTQAGLPTWLGYRPTTVVWASIDNDGDRSLISQTEQNPQAMQVRDIINSLALQRGLPVVFPLGDVTDAQNMSVSDLWGGFDQPLNNASTRYHADALLIIKLTQRGDLWDINWRYVLKDEQQSNNLTQVSLGTGLGDALNRWGNAAAAQYARLPAQEDLLTLMVSDMTGVQTYTQVYSYLKALDSVADVKLLEFNVPTVIFEVKLRGKLEHLKQTLEDGGVLYPVSSSSDQPNKLFYRYVPNL